MHEINKERFGAFLARLRKERGMTQRELADRLHVSDKAVSKWERALSLPDVSLLIPLADCLGVSVTELLRGERTQREELPVAEVEALVNASLNLTGEEQKAGDARRRRRQLAFGLCALAGLAQTAVLLMAGGFGWAELEDSVVLVEGLCLLFGAWLCFGVQERLPACYDQNRISAYSQGPFRINLTGVRLNNSNWPHILSAMRGWLLVVMVLFPTLWWGIHRLWTAPPQTVELAVSLVAVLGVLAAAMVAGKRYE